MAEDLVVVLTADTTAFEDACRRALQTISAFDELLDRVGRKRAIRMVRHLQSGQRSEYLKHPSVKANRRRTHRRRKR